jgi:hypothetical protein
MATESSYDEARARALGDSSPAAIEERVRRSVTENGSYGFYFRKVSFQYHQGVLVLEGQVPSFHLKQVLQTLLSQIDAVVAIDNRVEVVNARGVSSVHKDAPPR